MADKSDTRRKKNKTQRGVRALKAREPKIIEDPKCALFFRGHRTSESVVQFMRDLHALKKPHDKVFTRKNEILPFEDCSSIDFLTEKNDCALFCMVSSTKKRPDNVVIGRTFNGTVLDRLELGMVGYGPAGTLGGEMPRTPAKPLMIFQGEAWDAQDELKRVRNLLQDFFRGRTMERGMALPSLQGAPVLVFTAAPQGASGEVPGAAASAAGWLLHMRTYSLQLRQSGMRVPKVELSPAGPFADLEVRRTAWAEPERWKAAVRVPKELKRKREKNISYTALGERTGRLHMEHQDLDSIQTRKMKGLKAGRDALVEAAAAAMAEGSESEHDSDSLPSDASALEFESDGASDDE